MALINCPECGKEVSDSAVMCPNCGFTITQKNNNNERKSIPKKLLIIALVILVILLGICFFLGKLLSYKGYWDNNKWGTTYEDIKNKYGNKISESSLEEGALAMYSNDLLDVNGLDCMVNYSFNSNGGLASVTLICTNDSLKSDEEIKGLLVEMFSKEYGEGKEDAYGYDWETKVSTIKLRQYPTMQGGIVISFEAQEDINTDNKVDVSKSGVEDVINKMVSYLGTPFDTKIHGWDNPPSETLEIKGAGGMIFKGDIICCDDISQKTTIKEVYWRIENHNYFSKLYPLFTEIYGEPDSEFTRTSVEWDMGDYTILLQDNHDLTQVLVEMKD